MFKILFYNLLKSRSIYVYHSKLGADEKFILGTSIKYSNSFLIYYSSKHIDIDKILPNNYFKLVRISIKSNVSQITR